MNFDEYMYGTRTTAIYPKQYILSYPALGLASEAGEVCSRIKKIMRGDKTIEDTRTDLEKELGDCLWYLGRLADESGLSLDEIATKNLAKLKDRASRGVIKGDGDNR